MVFAIIILDYFFEIVDVATGDDEEDDEGNSDWLYDLQEPGGEISYYIYSDLFLL